MAVMLVMVMVHSDGTEVGVNDLERALRAIVYAWKYKRADGVGVWRYEYVVVCGLMFVVCRIRREGHRESGLIYSSQRYP